MGECRSSWGHVGICIWYEGELSADSCFKNPSFMVFFAYFLWIQKVVSMLNQMINLQHLCLINSKLWKASSTSRFL
jgi:hypothetical protein